MVTVTVYVETPTGSDSLTVANSGDDVLPVLCQLAGMVAAARHGDVDRLVEGAERVRELSRLLGNLAILDRRKGGTE